MILDKQLLDLVNGKRVLDLGALGNWRNYLEEGNLNDWPFLKISSASEYTLGVDLDSEGVQMANKMGFNVVCSNAESLDLKEKFDVIIAGDMIEHLDNIGEFLGSCKKHMHEKSILVISTPNPYALNFVFWSLFHDVGCRIHPDHTSMLHEQNLRVLLGRFGFEVKDIRYYTLVSKGNLRMAMTSRLMDLVGTFRKHLHQAYIMQVMLK